MKITIGLWKTPLILYGCMQIWINDVFSDSQKCVLVCMHAPFKPWWSAVGQMDTIFGQSICRSHNGL